MSTDEHPSKDSDPASIAGTFIALAGLVVVFGGGFLVFVFIFFSGFLDARVLLMLFLVLFGTVGQYLLWGRWLERKMRNETRTDGTQKKHDVS